MLDFVGRPLRVIHSSWRAVDAATLIMPAALGLCFFAHGGQKLFGWFGGGGITGTTAFFRSVGIAYPHAFAYVAGIAEFSGGIVIALGFLTVVRRSDCSPRCSSRSRPWPTRQASSSRRRRSAGS